MNRPLGTAKLSSTSSEAETFTHTGDRFFRPVGFPAVFHNDLPGQLQGFHADDLCRRAGLNTVDFSGKFVAIKLHFGELGNFAYIRPNYVKAVADLVKELGGKPFLTDCNTLYPGSRKNAVDHLLNADVNGFNYITTGCHNIIADGLKGTDDITVPVPNGEYCREAYIGRALYDADIIIVLSHFKGHEVAGFGGAIKNLGMGGGSKPERCSSTTTESPWWTRTCTGTANGAGRNAEATPSPMKRGRP